MVFTSQASRSQVNRIYLGVSYEPGQVLASVSGQTGTQQTRLPSQVPDRFISFSRLVFGERSDEPCYVSVSTEQISLSVPQPNPEGAEYSWNRCNGSEGSRRLLSRSYQDVAQVQGSWRTHHGYINSIRVCIRGGSGSRSAMVKGVSAVFDPFPGRAIGFPPPPFGSAERTRSFSRPNCGNDWRPPSECPQYHAATQLVLHHDAVGNRRALVGIQLACQRVNSIYTS
jgi:hypothetical protein